MLEIAYRYSCEFCGSLAEEKYKYRNDEGALIHPAGMPKIGISLVCYPCLNIAVEKLQEYLKNPRGL